MISVWITRLSGDTINLASRMESSASPGVILLSKNTQRLVRDYFELNSLGIIEVKGKEEPQEAFELIRAGNVDTRMGMDYYLDKTQKLLERIQ